MKKRIPIHRAGPICSSLSAMSIKEKAWGPLADIYKASWGWFIKIELAGIKPDELEITIVDERQDCLKISGKRPDFGQQNLKEMECYAQEIPYTRFTRKFNFSENLQNFILSWEYSDGMLLIKLKSQTNTLSNERGESP